MKASEIALALSSKLHGNNVDVSSFVHDSRHATEGSCFFAIKGEKYDGHDFVVQAVRNGAVLCIVSERRSYPCPYILVDDTIKALGILARYYRENYLSNVDIIAIAGASGKTTFKETLHSSLQKHFKVHRNPRSYNNRIGMPLTILNTPEDVEVLVLEIGINHPNEMEYLVDIAKPNIAVLLNLGPEHVEFFSSINHVAFEESLIFKHAEYGFMRKRDYVSYPNIHLPPHLFLIEDLLKFERTDVGGYVDLGGRRIYVPNVAWKEIVSFTLELLRFMGIEDPYETINLSTESMRMDMLNVGSFQVINDAYNANPLSMDALFRSIEPSDRNIFVLGDMLELGRFAKHYHEWIAKRLVELGHRRAVFVGKYMFHAYQSVKDELSQAHYFETVEELSRSVRKIFKRGDRIILKASRGMMLEKLLDYLF